MKTMEFPFSIDQTTHQCKQCDDIQSIKQSIWLILNTQVGERYMLPDFGSRIKEYMFEGMQEQTFQAIEKEILASLQKWEQRIHEIELDFKVKDSELHIQISYSSIYSSNRDELLLTFDD